MILLAAVVFGLAALGGASLLFLRLRGGNPPLLFVRAHGLVAATAWLLLLMGIVSERAYGTPLVALVLFGGAAGVGLYMADRHGKGHLVPIGAVFLHGAIVLLAATALLAHLLA